MTPSFFLGGGHHGCVHLHLLRVSKLIRSIIGYNLCVRNKKTEVIRHFFWGGGRTHQWGVGGYQLIEWFNFHFGKCNANINNKMGE